MNIKIKAIHIKNFRSILDLKINVEEQNGLIVFCGANNVGKTNVLKALALFFAKNTFFPLTDSPSYKYEGSRGSSYRPRIEVMFDNGGDTYHIIKDWNLKHGDENRIDIFEDDGEHGYKIFGTKNRNKLNKKEIKNFLKNINFFFLEAINISFPETIQILVDDVFGLETAKKRIGSRKQALKNKVIDILQGLKEILDDLASNISPIFERYKEEWGLGFDVPQKVENFRDLLIARTDFYIQDKSNGKKLDSKGSGLQRLSHILMHFRILEKFIDSNKNWIIAIDEPDVYLHTGLQKKLLSDMKKYGKHGQFFITTHSPIFIDCNTFENVFLLEQNISEKIFTRTGNKKHNRISTDLVDVGENIGIQKIKEYLGIEDEDFLIFDGFNILVEGDCDKVYLEKLCDIFGYEKPQIRSCDGADNIAQFLNYCDALAQENTFFRVILDNDQKGREQYKKLEDKKFSKIKYEVLLIDGSTILENDKNIEIEDMLPVEVTCELLNIILKKAKLQSFSKNEISKFKINLTQSAFKNKGVLNFLENKKNDKNPDGGEKIKIDSSSVKKNLAQFFKKSLNKNQIELLLSDKKVQDLIKMTKR
ncbi:ATP-dependent nuclease [Helicobacter pametensis]|uniref:ATP-dependent nuclease n=1 Tax=Helicobacter pametensis TaxID=95149 RepID=UPI000483A670|nr:AAA family ATPase [Helicobacter pametensis]